MASECGGIIRPGAEPVSAGRDRALAQCSRGNAREGLALSWRKAASVTSLTGEEESKECSRQKGCSGGRHQGWENQDCEERDTGCWLTDRCGWSYHSEGEGEASAGLRGGGFL